MRELVCVCVCGQRGWEPPLKRVAPTRMLHCLTLSRPAQVTPAMAPARSPPRTSCSLSCAMRAMSASTSDTVATSCGCSATSSPCIVSTFGGVGVRGGGKERL
jgi:hypothetical protein